MTKPAAAEEAKFFNAANIALDSSHDKLEKLQKRFSSWERTWQNLKGESAAIDPEEEWRRLENAGVRLFLRNDEGYPPLLREIPNQPMGLYVRGTLPAQENAALAIVGTRKATSEGKTIARRFSAELSARGLVIVSGLALGIDAAAHEGCIEAGGQTIAVLGNGLDRFYPRTNEGLAKKIIGSGGAIVSEYPLCAEPLPYRFLERNRIISGLARGVLVVEAPEASGALATARYAAEQNREVFVLPGHIAHPNYRGANQLIRQGAELVTKPEEILEAWGMEAEDKTRAEGKLDTAEEKIIFEVLSKSLNPLSANEIAEATKLNIAEVNRSLTFMAIKGAVKETEGGYAAQQ